MNYISGRILSVMITHSKMHWLKYTELTGDKEQSLNVANAIVDEMEKAANAMAKGDSSGHYADKEMAYAYLAVDNYDKAIEHALLEYNRRPDNIDANETVAWVYYKKADYSKAEPYIKACSPNRL